MLCHKLLPFLTLPDMVIVLFQLLQLQFSLLFCITGVKLEIADQILCLRVIAQKMLLSLGVVSDPSDLCRYFLIKYLLFEGRGLMLVGIKVVLIVETLAEGLYLS